MFELIKNNDFQKLYNFAGETWKVSDDMWTADHFDADMTYLHEDMRNKKAVLSQRWPRDARYISGSNEPLRRYGHSRILGAYETPIWGKGRS